MSNPAVMITVLCTEVGVEIIQVEKLKKAVSEVL